MTVWKTYDVRTVETVRRTYNVKARSEHEAREAVEGCRRSLEPVDIQELGEEIESGGIMQYPPSP